MVFDSSGLIKSQTAVLVALGPAVVCAVFRIVRSLFAASGPIALGSALLVAGPLLFLVSFIVLLHYGVFLRGDHDLAVVLIIMLTEVACAAAGLVILLVCLVRRRFCP